MRPAEWRALIAAYLDGRLSASAFQRRFQDAWRAAEQSGAPQPIVIENLCAAVDAYAAIDPGPDGDEADLRAAAEDALEDLDAAAAPERTFDRLRARDDMRRFQFRMQGCLGMGCLIALVWLALAALQVFAVSDQIQSALGWSAAPATFVGLVLAFVPLLGNVLAFFGAVDVWGWNAWIAGLVFFAAPAATLVSGWLRWRAYRA